MVNRVRERRPTLRPLLVRARLVLVVCACVGIALLASGCGSSLKDGDDARADVDSTAPGSCAATVLEALGHVATRVYREGVSSERTSTAQHLIESSPALRTAVEEGSATKVRAAAQALLATAHMTNLQVSRGGNVLADVGGPAVAPIDGALRNAAGKPIARYVTSVWADSGLLAETNGIAESVTLLRTDPSTGAARMVAGSLALPAGALPAQGTLTQNGVSYEFTSYAAAAYPAGEPLRAFVLRPISSTVALCGSSTEETTVNTISHIARLIYEGEAGKRTLTQIHRIQSNAPLLQAVARRDEAATRAAVETLLHEHVVRLRVSSRRRAARGRRRSLRARARDRAAAPARAHDRQLRALDPGRRGLQAPREPARGARRADVHGPAPRQEHDRGFAGADPHERAGERARQELSRVHIRREGVPVGPAANHRADSDAVLVARNNATCPRDAHPAGSRNPPLVSTITRTTARCVRSWRIRAARDPPSWRNRRPSAWTATAIGRTAPRPA